MTIGCMLHPNMDMDIPVARSQFIRYAAITKLLFGSKNNQSINNIEKLLKEIGAEKRKNKKITKRP